MAQCTTTALAGAVPRPCVRGARGRFWATRAGTWCCVSPVSPFPPRVSRAVCGGPSRPGVPYPRLLVRHSTLSVRSASSVRLTFWYSPRALLCVCARAPAASASPPSLPWVVWRAHLARSRRWALVGPFHAVRAPPHVLPRSFTPSGVLGGGRPGQVPPLPGLGLCAPHGVGLRVRGVPVPGGWVGGGGRPVPRAPPVCAARGASGSGGRSASFRPSAFPGQATKRVSLASFWSWRAWPPYLSGSCSFAVSGRGPCGALARWCGFACSPRFPREQAAGAGGRTLLRPPPRAPRSRPGEGGPSPLPRGVGAGAPAACGPLGGVVCGGGRAAAPLLSLWGAARGSLACPPTRCRRIPPRHARSVGVAGPPRAPGAVCLGGGRGSSPRTAPPGAPSDPSPPSALPEWATLRVSLAMLWSLGARPPYCSGSSPRAAPGRGPRVPPARWCGLACRTRPPREQAAGGAGARGVRVQLRPPPPRVVVPSGGGGAFPRLQGGGGSALLRPAGRRERRGGGPLRRSPPSCPVGCRPAIICPRRAPLGYTRALGVAEGPWASAEARSAASGSVRRAGGRARGGVISSPWFAPPPSPGRPLSGPLRLRRPGRRRSVVGR